MRVLLSTLLAVSCLPRIAPSIEIAESAREIPVAYQVDVVVVGGTSAGVTAAVAAAEKGADVFLAAQRPYLGVDLCGTYRLWLRPGEKPDDPLAAAAFAEPPLLVEIRPGLAFTYETDVPSAKRHKDTTPPSKLNDGKWGNAVNQSVEYPTDVTVTLDLKKNTPIQRVLVMAYHRAGDIELESVAVSVSNDNQKWTHVADVPNTCRSNGDHIDSAFCLSVAVKASTRYVRVLAKRGADAERILLAEVIVEPKSSDENVAPADGSRVPPMPMQVKRVFDQALLDAGVTFLYGCFVTDVLRDADGKLAGVVMANRAGRQAIRAKVIIDATPRAMVARMAGASFEPYPTGPRTFKRIVVGGEMREGENLQVRKLPTPVQIQQQGLKAAACRDAFEYTLQIPMKDGSFASFADADHVARDTTWHPQQVAASEVLFQIPPDPMHGTKHLDGDWPGAQRVDLTACRPKGLERLYVLGGCADVSRKAAEALLRPLEYMALGRRIGQAAAAEAGAKPKPTVVCFGDSITAGDYPAKLEKVLGPCRVLNAGVGGNTTGQGLARIEQDVLRKRPQAVVVLFGTNDSILTAPGNYKTPLEQYEKNLRAIVQRCDDAGAKVVLMTPPPIIEEPYFTRHPKPCYEAEGGLEKILQRYRSAVVRVGKSMNVPVIHLHEKLQKDFATLKSCGVHPTGLGEAQMAGLVAEALRPILAIPERKVPSLEGICVGGSKGQADGKGDVREFLTGPRSTRSDLPTVRSEARSLPVLGKYDVVVVGGGTGGAPAGIGAGRQGAKTLVLEYLHGLGGVGTLGLIGKYYYGFRKGFTEEIDRGVGDLGGQKQPANPGWNVEWKMEWYRRELHKSGAEVWYGVLGCGAVVDGDRVSGVVVATPEGRGVVLAGVVIDSTGNSDIAAAAGAECVFTDGTNVAVQGTGLPPRKPGASYTNTDYTLTVDNDMLDMWRTFVVAKAKFDKAYDLGQIIDTRERRRIVGDFVISPLDVFNERTYPDTVGKSHSNFDTHGYTIHPFFSLEPPNKKGVDAYTPYRALLPKGLEGILVTGLGISAHRDAMPILRMQPDIQNQGYAAGVAASMASRYEKTLRQIDLKSLQGHLVSIGCLPESVLTDKDSFPRPVEEIAQAVKAVTTDRAALGLILSQPQDALPLLRKAYAVAESDQDKLVYASILGMMGDPSGTETLTRSVGSAEWDEGWSFKGMGQFGGSLSPLDGRIIALGSTKDTRALQPILAKVAQLGPDSAFSHHRAVAVALETLRDPRAAKPLADLLKKPAIMGHAATTIAEAKRAAEYSDPDLSRNLSLRELILARALYRCGDCEGLGKRILQTYAKDLRGHHARHAQAILNEPR